MITSVLIGWATITEAREITNRSEYARWFDTIEALPGRYPIIGQLKNGKFDYYTVRYTGLVIRSNNQSCYGGVPIGKGGIDEHVGQTMTASQGGYGYSLSDVIMNDLETPGISYELFPWVEVTRTRFWIEGRQNTVTKKDEPGRWATTGSVQPRPNNEEVIKAQTVTYASDIGHEVFAPVGG
tara:strand:+ start:1081 stop:1626 length:546 start_codon:yes stop_codon:yes gene_type:complete